MATKSTKYEYNPFLKAGALLLALLFAGLTGANALKSFRALVLYPADTAITATLPFLSQLTADIDMLKNVSLEMDYSKEISYDNYVKNSPAAKEALEKKEKDTEYCLRLFDTIQKLKTLKPGGEDIVEDYYDGEYYPEEYYDEEYEDVTAAIYQDEQIIADIFDIKESYTSENEWETDYHALRSELFRFVNDATSKQTIIEDIDSAYHSTLDLYYSFFVTQTERFKHYKNLQFYVKDTKTGNSLTNLPDGTSLDDFKKTLKRDSCYYLSFDGEKQTSPPLEIPQKTNWFYEIFYNESYTPSKVNAMTESLYGREIYIKINDMPVTGDEYYSIIKEYNDSSHFGSGTSVACTVFAVLSIACLVFLIISCGKKEDGSTRLIWSDRIPFIIKAPFDAALIVGGGTLAVIIATCDTVPAEFFGLESKMYLFFTENMLTVCAAITFALISAGIADFAMYVKRNGDAQTFSRRFISGVFFSWLIKAVKNFGDTAKSRKKLPKSLAIKILAFVIINVAFLFGGLFWVYCDEPDIAIGIIIIAFIFDSVSLIFVIRFLDGVKKLGDFAQQLKNGNYSANIDSQKFVPELKGFASDLDDCRSINESAVTEAIKGERLKTELITNVSHDLKTPLTSIINYVSLLKLDTCTEEDKVKYLDILDEKSTKLKRLIEDLTEASKATSGNIKMNLMPVNLSELALQAVGENSDVLENVGLELVLNQNAENVNVLADSQHTFRIIDNLFSNAKKYSLTGTRVYVDVFNEGSYGCFSIKNVSKEKLNITPDELTERFVRGDNSRTTDGSGLGLSIARSFTELQNGIFNITIDGDMFKVTVYLPKI